VASLVTSKLANGDGPNHGNELSRGTPLKPILRLQLLWISTRGRDNMFPAFGRSWSRVVIIMRSFLTGLALFATFALLPLTLMAQVPVPAVNLGSPMGTSTGNDFQSRMYREQSHKTLAGRVYSPKGEPVANAMVEITNNAGAQFQAIPTDREGDFQADFNLLDPDSARNFVAMLKVTKKGFEVAHRLEEMKGAVNQLNIAINLRARQQDDPSLLSQADLIMGVAPRLRQLGTADGLQDKQQKDYARGVQDFLDRHHLEDAVARLAKVVMLDPQCLKCQTMLALAEMSWGDWDDPKRELVDAVNTSIKDSKLGCAEPLLVYGVMVSWKHEPEHAAPYFAEALKFSPHDPLALQELGRAEYMNMNWWAANESLQKALAAGAGPEARFMRAEALLWAGTSKEATDELNLYLNGRDIKSMPPRVRALQTQIQERKKDEVAFHAAAVKAQARGVVALDYLHNPPQNLPDLEPAGDQGMLKDILAAVGKNVSDLFSGLPNICSLEKVHQERLDSKGKPSSAQEYKYRYLALAPDHPWGPSIDEYRADGSGRESAQLGLSDNAMLTEGFVSAPLVFHPSYQSGSSFRLLGRQKVKGRNTYVIVYAQEPAKSSLSGSFSYGSITRSTYTQGLAWIDMENYQIIRITSDLLTPLPQLRLDKETTDITFSAVQFKQVAQKFWLPETVTVTLDWNGRTYRNNHAYSDFLVSNVESTQKIGKPKDVEKTVEDAIEPAPGSNPLKTNSLSLVPQAGSPPAN
jgi:tetratricopeptide (TPR) repeat protein